MALKKTMSVGELRERNEASKAARREQASQQKTDARPPKSG
ncbi:hypothetical protein [Streptomyces marianii]|nr:hypothetical protein [Streptomyces marianii]